MTVRSAEMKDGKVVPPSRLPSWARGVEWRALGALTMLIGLALWLIGARATVRGAPRVLDVVLGLFGIHVDIVLPTSWPLLGLTIVVGTVVSLIEFGTYPRRRFLNRSVLLSLVLAAIWAAANAGDWASTFVDVSTVDAASSEIARWVAQTMWARIGWTTVLTWLPEVLMLAGIRWLWAGAF